MSRRRRLTREERRENVLRPSHRLGYDHDQLGMHLMSRQAYAIAEGQFRRAVWLNPYEPQFKLHWAMALHRLDRGDQARSLVAQVLHRDPRCAEARAM